MGRIKVLAVQTQKAIDSLQLQVESFAKIVKENTAQHSTTKAVVDVDKVKESNKNFDCSDNDDVEFEVIQTIKGDNNNLYF
jgi:predicted phage tail protein